MSIKTFAKKNKLFTGITVFFLIWILILVILGLFITRTVVFWDALAQSDVSSQYQSYIPALRYIVEPFAAIGFNLGMDFTWIILFLLSYVALRIVYLYLRKKDRIKSEKYLLLKYAIGDFLIFAFQVCAPIFLLVGIIMGLGYLFVGFYFVNLYWDVLIHIEMIICFIFLLIKIVHLIVTMYHPNLRFNYLSKKRHQPRDRMTKRQINYQFSKREFIYFMTMLMMAFNTNFLFISIPFPTQSIQKNLTSDEVLIDLHVHTTASDGWLTPEQRVMWYIEQGVSVAAFSDHDNRRGAIAAQGFVGQMGLDFTVLMAEEWTDHANDIHMNIYGLDETIVPLESATVGGPKAMNAKDTIEYVKNNGGYITVNHYNYKNNGSGGYGVPYTLVQLRDWGVDGFEIINGNSHKGKYLKIREFCLNNSLICMSGTDVHTNEPLNSFIRLTLPDPNNKTVDSIFNVLRANTHSAVAIQHNSELVNIPGYLKDIGFKEIEHFLNYFLNLDSYQVLSWIMWSSGFFAIFVLIYREIKKVELALLRDKIL